MLVFKIVLIGIAGAILVMITKQFKPEYSIPVLLGICLFLIGYLTTGLEEVLKFVQSLQKEIPINNMYIKILFNLGYRSISFQIETIGKVSILLLSIPIIQSLLETVEYLLVSS